MYEINLTNKNFEQEVLNSGKIVLVDFWASWCGPCQMLSPIISEIAEEQRDKIKVCKVNVDEEQELSEKFKIVSIPTLIVFKNGEIKNKKVGVIPKNEIMEMIETVLKI